MEKEDIILINKIIELDKKILKIYRTLYDLEINNQNKSLDYKTNLNNLNLLIELENELYNQIPIEKIDDYKKYSDRLNSFSKMTDFSIIINDFSDLFLFKRIYNRLNKIEESFLIEEYQNEIDDDDRFDILTIISEEIHNDVLNSFIFETNIYSNKIKNKDYQNSLKLIKYIICFLNINLENKYKNNNFNIDNILYLTNRVLSDNFNISEIAYKDLLKAYYFKYIHKGIKNMTKKDLFTSDYIFQKYRFILQTILIKAYLQIDKNNVFLKKLIYDIIDNENEDDFIRNELDSAISYRNKNSRIIRSERLILNGNSKRF